MPPLHRGHFHIWVGPLSSKESLRVRVIAVITSRLASEGGTKQRAGPSLHPLMPDCLSPSFLHGTTQGVPW